MENSSRDGNTRPLDLPPEKSVFRLRSQRLDETWGASSQGEKRTGKLSFLLYGAEGLLNRKLSFLLHGAEGLLKLSVLSEGIHDPHSQISIINGGIGKG